MTQQMEEYCKKSYFGGLCDTFYVGEFKDVEALDINSSYPAQMIIKQLPIGPYRFIMNINRLYDGEYLL